MADVKIQGAPVRKGVGIEQSNGAQSSAKAGVWEHPDSKEQIITTEDPLFGNAMSEAVMRTGFVRVRDAQPEDIKGITPPPAEGSTSDEAIKGALARLTALERENKYLKDKKEASKTPKKTKK